MHQFEKYEIEEKYCIQFEEEVSKATSFLEVIEVVKRMIDHLMTHVGNITKYVERDNRDLFEFSGYDLEKNQQNIHQTVINFQKEIKIHLRVNKEQAKRIQELEQQLEQKDQTINNLKDDMKVLPILTQEISSRQSEHEPSAHFAQQPM